MSFDVHPILEAGELLAKRVWYAISPEITGESSGDPGGKVGASACCSVRESGSSSSVFVFAGATLEGPHSELHQLSFKHHGMKWSRLSSDGLPGRYEHTLFMNSSEGGKQEALHVFAGAKLEGPVNDMWKYDLESKAWKKLDPKGHIPSPRTFHSSSSMFQSSSGPSPDGSSQLVVFGGGNMSTCPIEDQRVYLYDTALDVWSSPAVTGSPPSPRQGHVTAVVGSKLYVHGGMAGQTFLEDIHCLDLVKNEWFVPTVTGTCPPPLAAHGSAVLDVHLFVFGGWGPSEMGPVAQDTLYCLHTDTMQWKTVSISGPPPPARFDFAMCTIKIPVSPDLTRPTQSKKDSSSGSGGDKKDSVVAESKTEMDAEIDCKKDNKKVAQKSFHAVTIIDPEERKDSFQEDTEGAVTGVVDDTDRQPGTGEKLQWMSAIFVFGGIDSSGLVHSDSFVIVP